MKASAQITFADGQKLTISEGDILFGIKTTPFPKIKNPSPNDRLDQLKYPLGAGQVDGLEAWSHPDAGLLEFFAEVTANYDYFGLDSNRELVYKSSAVVSVQII